jgi:hypothetical protein
MSKKTITWPQKRIRTRRETILVILRNYRGIRLKWLGKPRRVIDNSRRLNQEFNRRPPGNRYKKFNWVLTCSWKENVKLQWIDELKSEGYIAPSSQCFILLLLLTKLEINLVMDGGANSRGVNMHTFWQWQIKLCCAFHRTQCGFTWIEIHRLSEQIQYQRLHARTHAHTQINYHYICSIERGSNRFVWSITSFHVEFSKRSWNETPFYTGCLEWNANVLFDMYVEYLNRNKPALVAITNLGPVYYYMPIPVAARSKAWICGRSLTGIVGSNPA